MAIICKVKNYLEGRAGKKRIFIIALLVFSLFIGMNFKPYKAFATPSAPILGATPWNTGQLVIDWSNVTVGNAITLYTMDYHHPNQYLAFDTWTAETATGEKIIKPFENGQSIWYYIVQIDKNDGTISPISNELEQTPPITAFITNWQDFVNNMPPPIDNTGLLQSIKDAIDNVAQKIIDMNNALSNKIDSAFTPSDSAKAELQSAIDDAKNAIGAGQASAIGDALKTQLQNGQVGMATPVNNDDGVHTFTGGANPSVYPNTFPALDSGTDTPITFRIPLTNDQNHNPVYIKIFTAEQLEKLQWLTLLRKAGTYIIWIIFSFWVVTRFTPAFKV